VPTEKQKQAAAKKKERDELKELKEAALMHTEPKKKPDSAYRVFVTENISKGTKASEHMKEVAAKFKTLSAAELEVFFAFFLTLTRADILFAALQPDRNPEQDRQRSRLP